MVHVIFSILLYCFVRRLQHHSDNWKEVFALANMGPDENNVLGL